MKFRKIIIENYKSYQFPTELQFPDASDGKSIFLIGGMWCRKNRHYGSN